MHEVNLVQNKSQRRRSERVFYSIPLTVRGIDLLGQPFEERTATVVLSRHGCRYASKHHLPPNTWVTLEVPQGAELHNVRARVAWVQRPQSVREFFQVAVELESAGNIWGIDLPSDLSMGEMPMQDFEGTSANQTWSPSQPENQFSPNPGGFPEPLQMQQYPGFTGGNPLLRELTAELHRQAREAAEQATAEAAERIRRTAEETEQRKKATAEDFFQRWKEEFERAQSNARDNLSVQLAATQENFLSEVTSRFEDGFREAKAVLQELDQKTQGARTEINAFGQPLGTQQGPETAPHSSDWRERFQTELDLAQSQWSELLQSSLDSGMQRLSQSVADQSREALGRAERKLNERLADLRQPLTETIAEARETLNAMRSSLEEEMAQARSSLADIEHLAGRVKEYSSQLDASTHNTLDDLHRRIENIVESQTDEMHRRAEHLVSGVSHKLSPLTDSLGRELVERTVAEIESRIAPHINRVPDLLQELTAREVQAEEGLRLQRERLRQLSENSQREAASQVAAAIAALKNDLDAARVEALPRWNEDLNSSIARASQTASESIRQNSEALQQDAQARLQILSEQALTTAQNNCDEIASQSAQRLGEELQNQVSSRLAGIRHDVENIAFEVEGRARTQMDAAADAAAASFGHVLRGISDQEAQQFTYTSRNKVQESAHELEKSAQAVLANLSASAETLFSQFRSRMDSQLEASLADGRAAVSAEFNTLMNQFLAEKDIRQHEWATSLEQLSQDATAKHQERLQTAGDSWMVSSVRRLNEHGQNTIESLMRSADQALRDSCSRMFEGLAQMTRERTTNAAGANAFATGAVNNEMQNNPGMTNPDIQQNQNWPTT